MVTIESLTKNYVESINTLEHASASLLSAHERIVEQFQLTINELGQSCLELNKQATTINSVVSELNSTNKELTTRDNELTNLNQTFKAHSMTLTGLEEKLNHHLVTMEAGIAQNKTATTPIKDYKLAMN